jgi:imidazolonepropionase-like amidohydrolase
MYAVLGEQGKSYQGGARPLALLRLREVFEDARDYAENRSAFDAGDRREYALSRLDLEALLPVVRGELPLVLGVNRASDIVAALRLGEEYGLRLVLSGATEGWMVADEIAAAGVPVMTRAIANLPSVEALGATFENVARLHRAGVKVILSSFDGHNVRNLKQDAGFAVSYGMPHAEALRAVTLSPAEVWGVQDRMGSLDVGKAADVVVWSGDPFEILTSVKHVFINGTEISYDTRQKALFEKYRTLEGRPPWR